MGENNKDIEKKSDLGSDSGFENKDNLKESFFNLKNELNKLKNEVKEGQDNKEDLNRIDKIEKKIRDMDKTIEEEKSLEKITGGEGKISTRKELKIAKQIDSRLKDNPGEANKGRAQSALKLIEDIHGQLDTNLIARGAQWIVQKLTKDN